MPEKGVSARILAALGLAVIAQPTSSFAHGDLHERIEALTAGIRKDPKSAQLYLDRGELHRLHSDWDEAERDLNQAEKLDPKLAPVWLCRARLLLDLKKYAKAESQVERFLATQPDSRLGLTVKAHTLAAQKKFGEAGEVWGQIIKTSANPDVEPYYERAHALVAAGPKHRQEALRTLDDGMARLGKVPTLGLYAIELESEMGRYDAALARIEKLTPATGRTETWLELRGDILKKAGKHAESRAAYEQALEQMTALPGRIRSTKAGLDLEERLRKKLAATRSAPEKK